MAFKDFFKKVFNSFSWTRTREETTTKTKRYRSIPQTRNTTESYVVNYGLTYGLYHNSYPGLKLAGGLAFSPIALPVYFMGFPSVSSEDEKTQEQLNNLINDFVSQLKKIHIQTHRDGTVWIWPKYDSAGKRIILEFIRDDLVQSIIKDMDTGEILELYVSENITTQRDQINENVEYRTRHFTKKEIKEDINGVVNVYRNPLGLLPIPFANNADGDEIRGHSDYERIVPLLKAYHDISLNEYTLLARFKPKQVQTVKDVDKWLDNNSLTDDLSDYEIGEKDLVFNVDDEKTDFVFPQGMTQDHRETKKQLFHQIVEASGIPEILWGLKTQGNHASVEEQMALLVEYVEDKRRQKQESYKALFDAMIQLQRVVSFDTNRNLDYTIEWNQLDALSEKTKSEVFSNFARGLSSLFNVAAITKDQAYELWKELYPVATQEDADEYKRALVDMARFKQFVATDYITGLSSAGQVDENGEPITEPGEEGDENNFMINETMTNISLKDLLSRQSLNLKKGTIVD